MVLPNYWLCSTILCFICTYVTFSQDIQGQVRSLKAKNSLIGVNITVPRLNIGTTTDRKGTFSLRENPELSKYDTIRFSYVGYRTKSITIEDLKANQNTIYLEEGVETLEEVTINQERNAKRNSIDFEKLAPLPNGLRGFAVVHLPTREQLLVVCGDESISDNGLLRVMQNNPALGNPGSSIMDAVSRGGINLAWQHYSDKILSYDISFDRWTDWDAGLQERAYHEAFVRGSKVFIIGGKSLSGDGKKEFLRPHIEILDLRDSTVSVDRANPHQAIHFGTEIVGDNLIVLGGAIKEKFGVRKVYTDKVHHYHFPSGLWYELKSLPYPMEAHTVLVDESIFFIGGSQNSTIGQISKYNVATGAFITKGELFDKIGSPALLSVDKRIFIFDKGKLVVYDTEKERLQEYLIDHHVTEAEMVILEDYIYILGGQTESTSQKVPSAKVIRIKLSDLAFVSVNRIKSFED